VHSIEGIATPLQKLAALLPYPAYCFQVTRETPHETIESMAQHYIQLMQQVHPLTSAQAKGGYRLIGYSYGACIGFEMACQLQTRHGAAAVQQLVLLDGSVQYMQAYRRVYRQAYSLGGVDAIRILQSHTHGHTVDLPTRQHPWTGSMWSPTIW
jgi:thioesterase domain-containing protein